MAELSSKEKFARLKLARSESVGSRFFRKLLKKYTTAENALRNITAQEICSDKVIQEEIEKTLAYGAEFIFFEDDLYPPLLRETPDAPPLLVFLGNRARLKNFWQSNLISVVGARNSSVVANRFCRQISKELGQRGFTIVSGLARGIDSEAHYATLETGTIAVLASGIDVVYPKENQKLYDKIRENGAIFAEMPFGTPPQAQLFPRRNRIIAGISQGTLVIEAARQSGSLITAKFALEYGRNVFAVPGFPSDIRSEGGNSLLKEGAIFTTSCNDILENYPQEKTYGVTGNLFSDIENKNPIYEAAKTQAVDASEIHGKILGALDCVPITIDELIASVQLSPKDILSALSQLELENKVIRLAGQRVCLSNPHEPKRS